MLNISTGVKLWLHGFRCYPDMKFEFEGGAITLLDGPSGVGKSTIFEAITWCLYGKDQDTSHWDDPKSLMFVMLELEGFSIYRQRNASLLRVQMITNSALILEGPIAQSEIEKYFGSLSLWKSSSYIEPKEYNYLLGAPSAAKMDLLNSITFQEDDPTLFINRIITEIKEVERQLSIAQTSYIYDCNSLNATMAKNQIDMTNYRTDQEIATMAALIPQFKAELEKAKTGLSSLQTRDAQRSLLLQQESGLTAQISSIPTCDPQTIVARKEQQTRYQRSQQLRADLSNAERDLSSIAVPPEPINQQQCYTSPTHTPPPQQAGSSPSRFTHQDINQYYAHNGRYTENKDRALRLKVDYNPQAIADAVSQLKYQLSHQQKFTVNDVIAQIKRELDHLEGQVAQFDPIPTEQQITELRLQAESLLRSRNVIVCPHCSGCVRCVGDKWEIAKESPFNQQEFTNILQTIQAKQVQLDTIRSRDRKCDQFKQRVAAEGLTIESPAHIIPSDAKRMTEQEIINANQTITNLNSIVIMHPMDIVYPQACIAWWEAKDKKTAAEQQYNRAKLAYEQAGDVQPVDSLQLETDSNNLVKIQTLTQQLNHTKVQLSSYPCCKDQMKIASDGILEAGVRITTMESQYNLARITNMIVTQHQTLTLRHGQIKQMDELHKGLQRFKELAINEECRALQDTVDDINRFIEKNSELIFDDPITIELSLFKTLKTTGLEKPIVNLHIMYKGGELTNTKSLSDGEKERISLLLTLALYHVTDKKILILDESLVSVDSNTKGKCNKLIRLATGLEQDWRVDYGELGFKKSDAVVLIVCHNTCDGLYDKVIEFTSNSHGQRWN